MKNNPSMKRPKIPIQVNLTFRVPPELVTRLHEVAAKNGKRPSEMARVLLADGLATR